MAWLRLDVTTVNRRPQNYRQSSGLPPVGLWATPFIRKQATPNPPQISGTLDPVAECDVYLRVKGTNYWLERTKSDASGYFQFKGTYHENTRYEVCIVKDGVTAKIFQIDNPDYSRYLGNPTVHDSSGYTRT
jgi:hypothetical protein